ncbi:MAG: hypothetical protein ACI4NE_03920 [Succinivibrio sp.]
MNYLLILIIALPILFVIGTIYSAIKSSNRLEKSESYKKIVREHRASLKKYDDDD